MKKAEKEKIQKLISQLGDIRNADCPELIPAGPTGPCGDSFCYASCDILSCRPMDWLGPTRDAHNVKVIQQRLQHPLTAVMMGLEVLIK